MVDADAFSILFSTAFLGIVFHGATLTFASYIRQRSVPLIADFRKIVTLIFLALVFIWTVVIFASLLTSTDNACQGILVVAFAIDQTARAVFASLIVWWLTRPIAATFPKWLFRALVLLQLGGAATTAVYIRSNFLPLCVARVDKIIPPIALLGADGFLLIIMALLLPCFGLIKKVFRMSRKHNSSSRAIQVARDHSIGCAVLGYALWTGSSAPMILGHLGTPLILEIAIACVGLAILLAILICCPAAFVRTAAEPALPASRAPTPKPTRRAPTPKPKHVGFISPKVSPAFSQETTPGKEDMESPLIEKKTAEVQALTVMRASVPRSPDLEKQPINNGLGIRGVETSDNKHGIAFPGFGIVASHHDRTSSPFGGASANSRNASPAPKRVERSELDGSTSRRHSMLRRMIPVRPANQIISKPLPNADGPQEFEVPFSVMSLPRAARIERDRLDQDGEPRAAAAPRAPPKTVAAASAPPLKSPKSPGKIILPARDFPNLAHLNDLSAAAVSPLSPEDLRNAALRKAFPFPRVSGIDHQDPATQKLLPGTKIITKVGDQAVLVQGVDTHDWTAQPKELPGAIHAFPKHASTFSGPSPEEVTRRMDRGKPAAIKAGHHYKASDLWHFGKHDPMTKTPASTVKGSPHLGVSTPPMAERKTSTTGRVQALIAKGSQHQLNTDLFRRTPTFELEDTSPRSATEGRPGLGPRSRSEESGGSSRGASRRRQEQKVGLLRPELPQLAEAGDSRSRFFGGLTSILSAINPKSNPEPIKSHKSRSAEASPRLPSPHMPVSAVVSSPMTSKTLLFCHHPTSESDNASSINRIPSKSTIASPRSPFSPAKGNALPNNGYLSPLKPNVFVRKSKGPNISVRPVSAPSTKSPTASPEEMPNRSPLRAVSANFNDVAHYSVMAPSFTLNSPVGSTAPNSPAKSRHGGPTSPPQDFMERFAGLSDAEAAGDVIQASAIAVEKAQKKSPKKKPKKPRLHRYNTDTPNAHTTSLHEKGALLNDLLVLGDDVHYPEVFVADNLQVDKLRDLDKFQRRSGPADPNYHPAYLFDDASVGQLSAAMPTAQLKRSLSTSEFERFSIAPTDAETRASTMMPFDIQAAVRQSQTTFAYTSRHDSQQLDGLQLAAAQRMPGSRHNSVTSTGGALGKFRSPWKRTQTNTSSFYSNSAYFQPAPQFANVTSRMATRRQDSGVPPVPPINPAYLSTSAAASPMRARHRQSIDSAAPLTGTTFPLSDRASMASSADPRLFSGPASLSPGHRASFGFLTRGIDKMISKMDHGPAIRSPLQRAHGAMVTPLSSRAAPPMSSGAGDSTLTSGSAYQLLNANSLLRPHPESQTSALPTIQQSPHSRQSPRAESPKSIRSTRSAKSTRSTASSRDKRLPALPTMGSPPMPAATSRERSISPNVPASFSAHRRNNPSTRPPPPLLSFEDLKARATRLIPLTPEELSAISSPLQLVRAIQAHLQSLPLGSEARLQKSASVKPLLTALAVANARERDDVQINVQGGRISFYSRDPRDNEGPYADEEVYQQDLPEGMSTVGNVKRSTFGTTAQFDPIPGFALSSDTSQPALSGTIAAPSYNAAHSPSSERPALAPEQRSPSTQSHVTLSLARRPTMRKLGTNWADPETRTKRKTVEEMEWERLHAELNRSPTEIVFAPAMPAIPSKFAVAADQKQRNDASVRSGKSTDTERLEADFLGALDKAFYGNSTSTASHTASPRTNDIVEQEVSRTAYHGAGGYVPAGLSTGMDGWESGRAFVMRGDGSSAGVRGPESSVGGMGGSSVGVFSPPLRSAGSRDGSGVVRWPSREHAR